MIHARAALKVALWGAAALTLTACASNPAGWQGLEAEKAYDKALDVKRLAEGLNNDDYYQLVREGRIYVFSDVKDYKTFLKTGEVPLVVTKFSAGPNRETVKFALTKSDTKLMETKVGFKGAAQAMFEGSLKGLDKGFFGFVQNDSGYYVFDNWSALEAFKAGGSASGTQVAEGPEGRPVTYVGYTAVPADLAARFAAVNDISK